MDSTADSLHLDPTYVAGLLDAVGRVRFDISETGDGRYTVRPMLRLKPHETELRAAVLGEFLTERGYQYDFVERGYGDEFFSLQRRSDLRDLQSFLGGESATLVRELEFVDGVFADEFDTELLDPADVYRFLLARDELRYGWRPRGRYHVSPEDIAQQHEFDTSAVTVPSLPATDLRSEYAVEWVTGFYDGRCRYRPSIAQSHDHDIDYSLYPVARMHRAGVSPQLVTNLRRFCADYDLSVGDSSQRHTLNITFTGASNIRRVLDILFPRLLVLAEVSEALVASILPRFDEDHHHEKQGFYELFRDFQQVAEASGGPFKQRKYDPEYFADLWRDQLELVERRDTPDVPEPGTKLLETFEDIELSPEAFRDEPERYRSLRDRVNREQSSARQLRSLYNDRCQLCGVRLASGDGTGYAEIHHLRPLGDPHEGPDEWGNMLVLCPNHHADFDHGVVRVDPDDHSIHHPYDSDVDDTALSVDADHDLSDEALRYHERNLCRLQ